MPLFILTPLANSAISSIVGVGSWLAAVEDKEPPKLSEAIGLFVQWVEIRGGTKKALDAKIKGTSISDWAFSESKTEYVVADINAAQKGK